MEITILDKQRRLRHLYKIVDKEAKTITFRPNRGQEILMKAKKRSRDARDGVCRLIVLKARQLGMTTFELMDGLDDCLFKANQSITITAHKIDKMKEFFAKVKFAYDNIPQGIEDPSIPGGLWKKPKPQYNNVNEMYFPDNNSRIKISLDSRSGTPTRLHSTELAFTANAEDMMTGTLPSLPKSADMTIESTANGVGGYFHNLWTDNYNQAYGKGAFDCLFIPRYTDPLYVSSKSTGLPPEYEYIRHIVYEGQPLSHEQINRYCGKIEELKEKVKQEYPSNPEEAFITSGNPVFDQSIVAGKIKPRYTVDEIYADLRWYKKDKKLTAIYGVDTAEGGMLGDRSVVIARDKDTMDLLACYVGHIPADALCDIIDKINEVYETCCIGIEKNNTGLATIVSAQNYTWHKDIYRTKKLDEVTKRLTEKVGRTTTTSTRPLMIQEYEAAIRTGDITEIDERMESEMYTFVYNESNKPEAIVGCHDDTIMADGICYQMRHERIGNSDKPRVVQDTRMRRDYRTGQLVKR